MLHNEQQCQKLYRPHLKRLHAVDNKYTRLVLMVAYHYVIDWLG
ncbi:hypothetical protein VCR14J2_610133 [Vibrio coralliirubri]|uniref:Uncharacterized protein n=1 Tax=Vibrio coralliirubri TaxID=1516159 RepID=A0AA87BYB8_9VIBR|nr:hypothetical protein VCR4J2_580272 [Vibrio coralliirubri]CDT55860.1 hypothetical protein VCR31J2_1270119 [Vibrio coralliirubri]CDU08030.1 hypothetical protein VCR14J2_610133 [Vibrio coralliirubri]